MKAPSSAATSPSVPMPLRAVPSLPRMVPHRAPPQARVGLSRRDSLSNESIVDGRRWIVNDGEFSLHYPPSSIYYPLTAHGLLADTPTSSRRSHHDHVSLLRQA